MENMEMQWLLKEKYSGEKCEAFFVDCKSLALGEPLAFLIGWITFLNCKIWLDSRPLIPRPETEYWVEQAIAAIKGGQTLPLGLGEKPLHILDLCAGSGCIGTAIAKALPATRVDFSEIDEAHIPTIKKNLTENKIPEINTIVCHTNLFEKLPHRYDFILSNPPYIDPALNRTDDSVISNEPYLALFGGKDGMEVITTIIEMAPKHLCAHGQLWIEHEPEQTQAIQNLANANSFSCTTNTDQYQMERYSVLVLQ